MVILYWKRERAGLTGSEMLGDEFVEKFFYGFEVFFAIDRNGDTTDDFTVFKNRKGVGIQMILGSLMGDSHE